jgi:hypothetical protein
MKKRHIHLKSPDISRMLDLNNTPLPVDFLGRMQC